jgi:O-methyltransferase/8-demethyl-8-(2,3-dimethoxy-alpha-L-rhamnosyl)tetracenomycin-C 4'-O-methyltransferase
MTLGLTAPAEIRWPATTTAITRRSTAQTLAELSASAFVGAELHAAIDKFAIVREQDARLQASLVSGIRDTRTISNACPSSWWTSMTTLERAIKTSRLGPKTPVSALTWRPRIPNFREQMRNGDPVDDKTDGHRRPRGPQPRPCRNGHLTLNREPHVDYADRQPAITLVPRQATTNQGFGRGRLVQRYLNLLEASLTGMLFEDTPCDPWSDGTFDPNRRLLGRDWPSLSFTMIGGVRMRNLRYACETVLLDGVDGDFIETGVWRGGACILMRAILEAYGDTIRRVFVADSFAGLPPPDVENFPADAGDRHHTHTQLQVSRADVEDNFRRFGLLDERVVFLEGWFKDTLPDAPIDQLAVLRLDGDMYESTIEALDALYHKVSFGGFLIVDDYFLPACAKAVNDFRERYGITSPILPIDGWGVYWRVDHKPIQ